MRESTDATEKDQEPGTGDQNPQAARVGGRHCGTCLMRRFKGDHEACRSCFPIDSLPLWEFDPRWNANPESGSANPKSAIRNPQSSPPSRRHCHWRRWELAAVIEHMLGWLEVRNGGLDELAGILQRMPDATASVYEKLLAGSLAAPPGFVEDLEALRRRVGRSGTGRGDPLVVTGQGDFRQELRPEDL